MRTKITAAAAALAALFATSFVLGSAQATPLPVLKGGASQGVATLVGHGGHGGHGGGHGARGGIHIGGGGGGGHYAHNGGGKHYGYKGGGKHYAYKGHSHGNYNYNYNNYKRYGHHGYHRNYGWYGLPYVAYGYGGGCAWLYRNAIATGDPYWWNRYYACVGYY